MNLCTCPVRREHSSRPAEVNYALVMRFAILDGVIPEGVQRGPTLRFRGPNSETAPQSDRTSVSVPGGGRSTGSKAPGGSVSRSGGRANNGGASAGMSRAMRNARSRRRG